VWPETEIELGVPEPSMGSEKLKVARTDANNLVANLRGEVGEVITTWLLMRHFMGQAARLASGDPGKDIANRDLLFMNLLADKLRDELIGRLSELAEAKVGQLTFYFAAKKFGRFAPDAAGFTDFLVKHRVREKRNRDVSHKQLPERWSDHRNIDIPYRILVRAVALAVRLMKHIDRHMLGPSAPYSWREARKRRYMFMSPPRAGYMLVPYLNLSPEDRIRILLQELKEGAEVWSQVPTSINGQPANVLACKKWGIVVLGDRLVALDQYPLINLDSIKMGPAEAGPGSDAKR
jgi:hypothetical protein